MMALFFLVHPFYSDLHISLSRVNREPKATENSRNEKKKGAKSVEMGFAMQCSSYPYSTCVPHRFPQIPLSFHAYHCNGFKVARKNHSMVLSAVDDRSSDLASDTQRKRKVVEHVSVFKAKDDLSEEEENDMLDYLYTTQYQMGGVVAISLGRVSAPNPEHFTHALYMRFQRKENLDNFYQNPFYLKVLKEHVLPYCHGLTNVDYESEVEDEMLAIFRKGEEFNHGVEFVLLISFNGGASSNLVEHALGSLSSLMLGSPSLIVQFTLGLNFSPSSKEYTHGFVSRFRSAEAFEIFVSSKEYKDVWHTKFLPVVQNSLSLHFSVDPVGTEIM